MTRKYTMHFAFKSFLILFLIKSFSSCSAANSRTVIPTENTVKVEVDSIALEEELLEQGVLVNVNKPIQVAAERMNRYLPDLAGKRVAVVGNHSSLVNGTHLVDTLIASGVEVVKVFAPEHGFRGTADAGEHVTSSTDPITGLPIVSLYGNNKKPRHEQLVDVDLLLFDIQDVGVRFYTYISTLHYVMEAAAEDSIPLIVLDRPNPNAHYVDGPVMEDANKSFVGMHKVPIVYGMTIGEYAQMINGEAWLPNGLQCDLKVVKIKNYRHNRPYSLPVPPSPNLKSDRAIALYPSLCLLEATVISCGRGTPTPFEHFGHPSFMDSSYQFVPESMPGATSPKFMGKTCFGVDLRNETYPLTEIRLEYLFMARDGMSTNIIDQPSFFARLAGTTNLSQQLNARTPVEEIRASWKKDLEEFKTIRAKYLLYE